MIVILEADKCISVLARGGAKHHNLGKDLRMGTTSATRRESYVLLAAQAAAHRTILSAFSGLGKGDVVRGVLLFSALLLSLAGCLAPHASADVLSALLFVAASALGLLAVTFTSDAVSRLPGVISRHREAFSSAPRPLAQRARPLPRTLQDVVLPGELGAGCDLAH